MQTTPLLTNRTDGTPLPISDHPSVFKRYVSAETLWLSAICMADLLTTLYWVAQGSAREGNPMMAYFLEMGPGAFIAAKIFTFAPALALAEWYRPRNPRLILRLLRWVIFGYLAGYLGGVAAHYGNALDFYRQAFFG